MEQENAFNYDKGVLAEILEPIMGKGLIPADLETWKPRRRAIVPAFHKAYLDAMVAMFGRCTHETIRSLDALTAGTSPVTTCNASLQSRHIQDHAVLCCVLCCPRFRCGDDCETTLLLPLLLALLAWSCWKSHNALCMTEMWTGKLCVRSVHALMSRQ